MLGEHQVAATLAVTDLDAARRFYEGTLGLTTTMESPEAVVYGSGGSSVLVYRSEFAGTNQATAATWRVEGDLDAVMDDLRSKGVTFEHYDDLPGTTREGDVHVMGDSRGAWFRDPDGNILALFEG